MKVVQVINKANAIAQKTVASIGKQARRNLTSRRLPNAIGAIDENYGAIWVATSAQRYKIRKIWEQVPQSLKDAIKNS